MTLLYFIYIIYRKDDSLNSERLRVVPFDKQEGSSKLVQ